MSMCYICSPYRGVNGRQVAENIEYAKTLTRKVLFCGHSPVTPHLYMTRCLNDAEPLERKTGLEAALKILKRCDAVVVGQRFGISEGMAAEIAEADKAGIPVFYLGE